MTSVNLDGWDWLGQPLALDLANSLPRVRPDRTRDLLASEEDLDRWLARQADRLGPVRRDGARLDAFRELRDLLHEVMSTVAAGRPLAPGLVKALNAMSARSTGHLRLQVEDGGYRARLEGSGAGHDRALSTIARSAIELLASPDCARLRVCSAPACGFFFLARRDQEWCSVPCGNRARAARHYARHRR